FFFQAEDGIRDRNVTGVQTCALPIWENVFIVFNCNVDTSISVFRHKHICLACQKPVYELLNELALFNCTSIAATNALSEYLFSRSEERRVGQECRFGG